jgi:5'-deoxynucleotidase YfbR-like HD superfamily hydrolase
LDPRPEEVHLEDIAHALSHLCRFGGHTKKFYSVAQHCVLASEGMPMPEFKAWALMHDATEAYCGDLIKPIKNLPKAQWYKVLEKGIMRAICKRFGLGYPEPEAVVYMDLVMLATERRDLLPEMEWGLELPEPKTRLIIPWSSERAKKEFLKAAQALGLKNTP